MSRIESLEGKSVALVGLGISQVDFAIGLQNGRTWDEVWCINSAASTYPCDRIFMLDPASRFFDTNDAGKQTKVMCRVLEQTETPVYTCELDPRIKNPVMYPVEEVCNATKCAYLNNTVAYALAYAVAEEVSDLHLYGIDFTHKAVNFAEAGRACCEFWLAIAVSKGIKLHIANSSSLLDTNVSEDQKLYGYHRLDDPLISTTTQGEMLITKKSKLEPPEPLDATPNIIGREDIPGVTFEEKKDV